MLKKQLYIINYHVHVYERYPNCLVKIERLESYHLRTCAHYYVRKQIEYLLCIGNIACNACFPCAIGACEVEFPVVVLRIY